MKVLLIKDYMKIMVHHIIKMDIKVMKEDSIKVDIMVMEFHFMKLLVLLNMTVNGLQMRDTAKVLYGMKVVQWFFKEYSNMVICILINFR